MPHTPIKDYHRTIDETFAVSRRARLAADKLLTLGYASVDDAVTALASATVQMVVPLASPAVTVAATVAAEQVGDDVLLTITIQPPVELTDAVQEHDYYVILEPGSATSEERLWRGRWTVSAAPEAV